MAYNSDYDVRLATLGALGGDTAKTYDSVYDIDLAILDAIEHGGGGGGMDYNQMKQLLAASGVTEILFIGNGSGETVTLDYDLISQIGQGGGGDYICVSTIDELSGITDPKDGMLVYVGAHEGLAETIDVEITQRWDGDWDNVYADYGGTTAMFGFWDNSVCLRDGGGEGKFDFNDYSWFNDINQNLDKFPATFTYPNGVRGSYLSRTYGENDEYTDVVRFYPRNGVLPSIRMDGNGIISSGVTSGDPVEIIFPAKGYFRYYADEAKWFAYEVWLDNLDDSELDDILQDYYDYRKPLSGWFKKDDNGWAYRKGFAGGTYETSEPQIHFTTPVDYTNGGYWKAYSKQYYRNDSNHWGIYNDIYDKSFVSDSEVRDILGSKIYTTSQSYGGIEVGGLYNVGVNETVSGVTISTTINLDATATSENHIVSIYNRNSGRGNWEQLSEDGWLFTNKGGISASTSPEWYVIDYSATWDGNLNKMVTYIAAARIEDNGDDTFTVTYFLTNDNWEEEGYDDRGRTDYYEWQPDGGRGYTWTVTEHQTLTVTPHLYTQIRFEHGDNTNARYIHKLV